MGERRQEWSNWSSSQGRSIRQLVMASMSTAFWLSIKIEPSPQAHLVLLQVLILGLPAYLETLLWCHSGGDSTPMPLQGSVSHLSPRGDLTSPAPETSSRAGRGVMHSMPPPQHRPLAKSCKAQLPVFTSWTSELKVAESSKRNKAERALPFLQPGRGECLRKTMSQRREP